MRAYVHAPPLYVYADVSSGAKRSRFSSGSSSLHPYFLFASSEGSGEYAHLSLCYSTMSDKNQNPMSWLMYGS